MKTIIPALIILLMTSHCTPPKNKAASEAPTRITFAVLAPGHFHAALVLKEMYEDCDSLVYVYAPEGKELAAWQQKVAAYNNQADNPTHWKPLVYTGDDFSDRMIADKKANVVILSGNNRDKIEYIDKAVDGGFHVLADKPLVINSEGFGMLCTAFDRAAENNLLLCDIMTERYEIATMLQREFSRMPRIFGRLQQGDPDNPAITKESVHHFYKLVSGTPLVRPAWFFDVEQQGEGLTDVTTHLIDLVMWECFPEQAIDYRMGAKLINASHSPTLLTLDQFTAITGEPAFPAWLKAENGVLPVYANGVINFTIRGVHARVSVRWNYKAPEGGGDTHYSVMRGSKANLVIRQDAEQNYKPVLYIEYADYQSKSDIEKALPDAMDQLCKTWPGLTVSSTDKGWTVNIPDALHNGHEAHFAQVTKAYLGYLRQGSLPEWEVPNMLTKYYLTTQALEWVKRNDAITKP